MKISKVKPEFIRAILGDKVKHLSDSAIRHIISYFDNMEGQNSEFNPFKFIGWKKCDNAKDVLKRYLPKSEFDKIVKEFEEEQAPYILEDESHYFYNEKLSSCCETIKYINDHMLYRWYKK